MGLVAGLVDDLGIVEKIHELVGQQPGEIVSPGWVVKAMIINGLGVVSAPLYLSLFCHSGKTKIRAKFLTVDIAFLRKMRYNNSSE